MRPDARLPRPHLYLFVFLAWAVALAWFHSRVWSLWDLPQTPLSQLATLFFIVFMAVAWLYGFYNVGVVLFAMIYRARSKREPQVTAPRLGPPPPVAILYTTCNDFQERSADSCLAQDYPSFTLYILDDSSDAGYRQRIDAYAARHAECVRVVRRADRAGYKAGNINHGLRTAASQEPIFALVDADEILRPDFLSRLVPRLLADEHCGFVQANHQCNPQSRSPLAAALGAGIDIHWRWYQPLRNRYGFVMLLGHGAVIRRRCWEQVGGFPPVVSEDLAFALRIREYGWRGHFAEDVACFEDFPETIRAFRVRHMKWTRGTCELLARELGHLVRSRRMTLVEKLDVLFPTLNLPLSLVFFLFILDANIIFPRIFGQPQSLTFTIGSAHFLIPSWRMNPAFDALGGPDFFFITVFTLLAPILCFLIELAPRPLELFRFLSRSTAVYGALGPLSAVGVVFYLATGQAVFHVTADSSSGSGSKHLSPASGRMARLRRGTWSLLAGSHPDHPAVQAFEIASGVILGLTCLKLLQISFFGIALAYVLLPVLHHVSWEQALMKRLIYLPFLFLLAGIGLGMMTLFGLQPLFFSFGFHF